MTYWRDGRLIDPDLSENLCQHHVGLTPGLWCGACNELAHREAIGKSYADEIRDQDSSFTQVNDCPECRQGKHPNCTQMVLVEHNLTDNYEPCPCKMREHKEETR